MSSNQPAAIALILVLLAQVVAGVSYIERTTLSDGPDEQAYVLWDDAMISMRYARNLAAGDGFVWNPNGERVQGYTNLGLALVMAVVHKLGAAPERAALWIQLLALGCLLATSLLAAALVRRATNEEWPALGAALALLLCSPHQIYALQGSDTIFVSVLLLAGCARLTGGSSHKNNPDQNARYALDGFVPLLVAVLVRPDASLFVVCAAGVVALLPDARGRLLAAVPLAGLAGVWAGLVGFSLSYYGDPLPNTWYLKATGSPIALMLESGFAQLASFGVYALPFALLALGCRSRVSRAANVQALRGMCLLGSFVAVGAAYHVWVGGDWMRDYGSRHLVQQLPALIVLGAIGASPVYAWLTELAGRFSQRIPQPLGTFVFIFSAGAILNPPAPGREWFDPSAPTLHKTENQGNFDRARFLAHTTRPDTTVAAHWAGVGPYFAERESLDVLGRSDRHIARMEVDRFLAGHSKWDWDYVLETRKPDIIDFESRGLRQHPTFLRDYAALVVGPQSFLLIRKDAADKILDPSLAIVPLVAERP